MVRSSPHQGRFIVTFDGVDGHRRRRGAPGHRRCSPRRSRTPTPCGSTTSSAPWSRTPTGSELGTVAGVEANPASDLLVLDGGGLIPLRFVVGSEPGVRVTVDIPDGLLDLP